MDIISFFLCFCILFYYGFLLFFLFSLSWLGSVEKERTNLGLRERERERERESIKGKMGRSVKVLG